MIIYFCFHFMRFLILMITSNYIFVNKLMLSQRIGDSKLKESEEFPKDVRDVMREILRQKDEVIEQLNIQLREMQNQIKQIADRIESSTYSNLTQFNLQSLRKSGFIWQNQEKHIIIVDMTALVKSNRSIFQMDSNLIILKQQNYDNYANESEQISRNYLHLLEQFNTLQKIIIQKNEGMKTIIECQRQEIAASEVEKQQKQAIRCRMYNSTNSNDQLDKLLEQNELLKMQLDQLKNQAANYRKFSEKKHQVNKTQGLSLKDQQVIKRAQNMIFQLKELQTANQKLTAENNDLKRIRNDLAKENDFLIEECKKRQVENEKLQNIISDIFKQNTHQPQKNQENIIEFPINGQKELTDDYQQKNRLGLNDLRDGKMESLQYTAHKNDKIQSPSEAQNVNGIAHIDFQLISPISFPQASTNHKEKHKKHKPRHMIRLGY